MATSLKSNSVLNSTNSYGQLWRWGPGDFTLGLTTSRTNSVSIFCHQIISDFNKLISALRIESFWYSVGCCCIRAPRSPSLAAVWDILKILQCWGSVYFNCHHRSCAMLKGNSHSTGNTKKKKKTPRQMFSVSKMARYYLPTWLLLVHAGLSHFASALPV